MGNFKLWTKIKKLVKKATCLRYQSNYCHGPSKTNSCDASNFVVWRLVPCDVLWTSTNHLLHHTAWSYRWYWWEKIQLRYKYRTPLSKKHLNTRFLRVWYLIHFIDKHIFHVQLKHLLVSYYKYGNFLLLFDTLSPLWSQTLLIPTILTYDLLILNSLIIFTVTTVWNTGETGDMDCPLCWVCANN